MEEIVINMPLTARLCTELRMMMMGILFSRSVDVHVDKCLRFCRGVPKFYGARSSVHRRAVKGSILDVVFLEDVRY